MEEILMLYYEINNIYLELYKMELNDNKDSFFLELIGLLKEKIEEEKELFRDLVNEYGDGCYNLCKLDEELDTPFAKRIADYMKFSIDIDDENNELVNEKINYAKLYSLCGRNIYLIYLSFLQESIDLVNNSSLRDKLLNYKYFNSFINHDIENNLIFNNFDIGKINYINLSLIGMTLKLDKDVVDKIIYECLEDTVVTTIIQLLSISDIEYCDDNRRCVSINNQCMLRAGLSIFDENNYRDINNKIYDLINKLSNDTNKVSRDIILSIIDNRNMDKSRIRKISFGFVN